MSSTGTEIIPVKIPEINPLANIKNSGYAYLSG